MKKITNKIVAVTFLLAFIAILPAREVFAYTYTDITQTVYDANGGLSTSTASYSSADGISGPVNCDNDSFYGRGSPPGTYAQVGNVYPSFWSDDTDGGGDSQAAGVIILSGTPISNPLPGDIYYETNVGAGVARQGLNSNGDPIDFCLYANFEGQSVYGSSGYANGDATIYLIPADDDVTYISIQVLNGIPSLYCANDAGGDCSLGEGGGGSPPDTSTRFISVTPANATTTATTTTLGQDVYVNASDLSSTTAVTTTYSNPYCSSFSGAVIDAVSNTLGQGCSFSLTWDVPSSGESSYSTTTTFTYGGTWHYVSTISDTTGSWCLFSYCLFTNTTEVAQTDGTFIVGDPNALDVINGYIASSSGELSSLATSSAAVSSLCDPLSGDFSLGSCIYVLIIPDASTTEALISGVSGKFLTYAPLGYVTRFIAIFASGTTTPLPVFSYTPPAVVGYSQGAITLNPWNLFGTSSFIGSLTSSTSTGLKTLRQIAEPYWDFLWTLVLALAIIARVTGIHPHMAGPQDTATKGRHGMKHVDDETYRYKEKLYGMSKRK